MKQSANIEIAALQLKLRHLKDDYESAIINEVEFDNLKIIRQVIKKIEETISELQLAHRTHESNATNSH